MNKQSLTYALIAVAVVLALYLFWDYALEIIVGMFGLGGAVVAAKQKKAEQAETVADEHEDMADMHLTDSVNEMNQAVKLQNEAAEIANNMGPVSHDNLPPGFKPTTIKSR